MVSGVRDACKFYLQIQLYKSHRKSVFIKRFGRHAYVLADANAVHAPSPETHATGSTVVDCAWILSTLCLNMHHPQDILNIVQVSHAQACPGHQAKRTWDGSRRGEIRKHVGSGGEWGEEGGNNGCGGVRWGGRRR